MFRMISESMLANVIAFEEAGVPLHELKQALGRDGGIIIGQGVVFQTPIERASLRRTVGRSFRHTAS
jgi:hypothetical protein